MTPYDMIQYKMIQNKTKPYSYDNNLLYLLVYSKNELF